MTSDHAISPPDPADTAKYCMGCYYALSGMAGNRCPECGRGFDPADRRTWSASPSRWSDVRAGLSNAARWLSFGVVGVTLLSILGSATGVVPSLFAKAFVVMFSPIALLSIVLACLPWLRIRWWFRAALVLGPALCLSVPWTAWPLAISVRVHRPWLDGLVADARAGRVPTGTKYRQIGLLRLVSVQAGPGTAIGLQLNGGPGGGEFLVHRPAPVPPGAGRPVWYNTNWEMPLGGGWFMVEQD